MNLILNCHLVIVSLTIFNYLNIFLDLYLRVSSVILGIFTIIFIFIIFSNFNNHKKEFITTLILANIFSFSILRILIIYDYFFIQIYIYLISLCIYHFMEYMFVCKFHFKSVNFNSKFIFKNRLFN